jgi:hypothetical protein
MKTRYILLRGTIILTLVVLPLLASAQTFQKDSIWKPFKFFTGSWKGKGGGEPGKGDYERSYQFILNNNFIEVKNKSTYPPSDKKPTGEVHQDIGYVSYDRSRKTFVLRQFHIESFVNQYKLDSISKDGKRIVFLSEAIENIPTGWRAKETYQLLGDDQFTEVFELAPPNKDFEVYSTVTLFRSKE